MIKGLYTAALGMSLVNKEQEVVANNLANCNTKGYKKETTIAQSFPEMIVHRLNDPAQDFKPSRVGRVAMGARLLDIPIDYTPGEFTSSDSPLTLALKGEGYFTVNTPRGERYTRNGQFCLAADGTLTTSDGYAVMGNKGEIKTGGEDISISEDGFVSLGEEKVDRLKIVALGGKTEKEGASLFKSEEIHEIASPSVIQNFAEESNVKALEEMVKMIQVVKVYESNQKVIQTIDGTLDKAVNELGRA